MVKKLITLGISSLLIFSSTLCAFAESDYSNFTGKSYVRNSRFDNCLVVNGVDVSHYQDTDSDWVSAKHNGMDFAIIRVTMTYANSGKMDIDDEFEKHYKRAGEAGLMRGVYVFSQALNAAEGKKEAQFAVKRLKELGIGPNDLDLPVYMDYEFFRKSNSRLHNLTHQNALAAATAFCNEIRLNGYEPGIYANESFFRWYLENGKSFPTDTALWCAQYNSRNTSDSDYSIWQYSSSARVPNIYENGTTSLDDVDANFWYIDQTPNDEAKLTISGNTNVEYTGADVLPELTIKDGSKTLKEGVDYTVGGINNIEEGAEAYVYVRGIGKYKGYALIPFTIGTDFVRLNLPGTVIEDTDYDIVSDEGHTAIEGVPSTAAVGNILEHITIQGDEMRAGIIDANGNELSDDSGILFSDMLGIFNGDTLVGTVDITLDNENKVNYLERNRK